MKYINREDRSISHIDWHDYMIFSPEDLDKYEHYLSVFRKPLCNVVALQVRDVTITDAPLYRMCKLCLKVKNRKTATCGYYPPNEFA